MNLKITALVFFLFVCWISLNGQTFKAGAAMSDITPKYLIPISGGMGTPEIPTGFKGNTAADLKYLDWCVSQMVTIPGEALPNTGFYVKRKMKSDQPFLFGLTNDAFGYILTKEDFGGFERYNYNSRTSPGEMTGSIFEDEAIILINESPAPAK